MNKFFCLDDERAEEVLGQKIHKEWWSRQYEYPWAIQFAHGVAADMGCGWMDRPFKDMLAQKCEHVFAVDADPRVLGLKQYSNLEYIASDMTNVEVIPDQSCDQVFCISVLEDLGNDALTLALLEFKRILKNDGLIVLTFDMQYNMDKPLAQYPAVDLAEFLEAVSNADLQFFRGFGEVNLNVDNILHNTSFNLSCYNAVLEKRNE